MTEHQARVLELKLAGLSNPQIAERLSSTADSVKVILSRLRKAGHELAHSAPGFRQGIGRLRRRAP